MPMSEDGDVELPLWLGYQDLRLQANPSRLQWQGKHWQWQGALALQGQWQGFQLEGHWQGQAASKGLQGEPITLDARNGDDHLAFRLPLKTLQRAPYGARATLKGQYAGYPLDGSLSFRQGKAVGRAPCRPPRPFPTTTGVARFPCRCRGICSRMLWCWRMAAGFRSAKGWWSRCCCGRSP